MPIVNLGRFGRFRVTRLNDHAHPPSTVTTPAQHKESVGASIPPPSYSFHAPDEGGESERAGVFSTPDLVDPPTSTSVATVFKHTDPAIIVSAPSQAKKPTCAVEQLCRYLIEILALTFHINFDHLNSALHDCDVGVGSGTILTEQERNDLRALSASVRKVHGQIERQEINAIRPEDETRLRQQIISPGEELHIFLGGYSLDLIGWYNTAAWSQYPPAWRDTIPGLWHSLAFFFLETVSQTLANVIKHISPNEGVKDVLSVGLMRCTNRCGILIEEAPRRSYYSPYRNGYHGLRRAMWESYMKSTDKISLCRRCRHCNSVCGRRSLLTRIV